MFRFCPWGKRWLWVAAPAIQYWINQFSIRSSSGFISRQLVGHDDTAVPSNSPKLRRLILYIYATGDILSLPPSRWVHNTLYVNLYVPGTGLFVFSSHSPFFS
ncbi:unnamed protein product, partial [Laminaria digitata]